MATPQRKRPRDGAADPSTQRRRNQEEVDLRAYHATVAPKCDKCLTKAMVCKSSAEAKHPDRLFFRCPDKQCDKTFLTWCEAAKSRRSSSAAAAAAQHSASPPLRPAAAVATATSATPERNASASSGSSTSLHQRLLDAAQEGDADHLRSLLKDDLEAVRPMLDEVGLARRGSKRSTALRYAAFHGFERCVRALLAAGALPNLRDEQDGIKDQKVDALALARLGRDSSAARGPPGERAGTIAALAAAAAADAWEVKNVDTQPELNGSLVCIVRLQIASNKATVWDQATQAHYKLSRDKLCRRALQPGVSGSIVGLKNTALNGCAVRVSQGLSDRGRYTVRLEKDCGGGYKAGSELQVKRENLVEWRE